MGEMVAQAGASLLSNIKEYGNLGVIILLIGLWFRIDALEQKVDSVADANNIEVRGVDWTDMTLQDWVTRTDKFVLKLNIETDLFDPYEYPGFSNKRSQ